MKKGLYFGYLLAENGAPMFIGPKFLEAGGAPRSLWVASGYFPAIPVPQTDVYLLSIPVGSFLDDGLSAVRPSVAWNGTRLWLVAEHGGELKYRIRDQRIWSGWHSLAPPNITPKGGAAVIADASWVAVIARSSTGVVHSKGLVSATTCAPGSCVWGNWGPGCASGSRRGAGG